MGCLRARRGPRSWRWATIEAETPLFEGGRVTPRSSPRIPMRMSDVAFLCLGTMGYPMAGHLRAAGHAVSVYNRNPARATDWLKQHRGAAGDAPGGTAQGPTLAFPEPRPGRGARSPAGGAALNSRGALRSRKTGSTAGLPFSPWRRTQTRLRAVLGDPGALTRLRP